MTTLGSPTERSDGGRLPVRSFNEGGQSDVKYIQKMFLILLPIFLIVIAGWFFKKIKIADDNWINVLNGFAYYIALPSLIITSFWGVDFFEGDYLKLIASSVLAIIVFALFVFIMLNFLKLHNKTKASIFLAAIVGNTVYMGFPVIELSLGKSSISAGSGVVYLILPLLISIFAITYWLGKETSIKSQILDFIKNPLVISFVIAIFINFIKIDSPIFSGIKTSLLMLGATASPLALFMLGGFLYGKFLKRDIGLVLFSSFLKLLIFPFAMLGAYSAIIVWFFNKSIDLNSFDPAIILSSMPVAVTTFLIAQKFNLDKDLVANSIIVSTIASFFLLPVIISFIV
ncbi:MAG: AEC family transporter [bacterium]|nr:AEC family transporter [bacterium]